MKFIRKILIGVIVGGAFGSKLALYLSNITGWSYFESLELGFTYGASIVSVSVALFLAVHAVSDQEKSEVKNLFTSNRLFSSNS
ncbi:MAG: hypothetical protein AB8B73_00250 [Ekhidna sp.]